METQKIVKHGKVLPNGRIKVTMPDGATRYHYPHTLSFKHTQVRMTRDVKVYGLGCETLKKGTILPVSFDHSNGAVLPSFGCYDNPVTGKTDVYALHVECPLGGQCSIPSDAYEPVADRGLDKLWTAYRKEMYGSWHGLSEKQKTAKHLKANKLRDKWRTVATARG